MKNEIENKAAKTENMAAVTFKKVMRGFDPEEVLAYIEEMSRTMQAQAKNYEMRMADMKQALALANRERDTLLMQCGDAPPVPEQPPVPQTAEAADSKQQEALRMLEAELQAERAQRAQLEQALQSSNAQVQTLTQQCAQLEPVQAQYADALGQVEAMKAQLRALQEEKEMQSAEIGTARTHYEKVETENGKLKTELSRVQVENALLEEKNESYKKEIADMHTQIQEKAYAYAEKLSEGEDALRKEQVKLQKKIQMQNYHIDRAGAAIEELSRQLQEIRASFTA